MNPQMPLRFFPKPPFAFLNSSAYASYISQLSTTIRESIIKVSLISALAGRVRRAPSFSHSSSIRGETLPDVATLTTSLPLTASSTEAATLTLTLYFSLNSSAYRFAAASSMSQRRISRIDFSTSIRAYRLRLISGKILGSDRRYCSRPRSAQRVG